MNPLFSRQYIAMALSGKRRSRDVKITWSHVVLEKLTIAVYIALYPLSKIPIIKSVWETVIRTYSEGIVGFFLRAVYYKSRLRKMGTDVFIDVGVIMLRPERIEIGNRVHINIYTTLIGLEGALIQIGDCVHIASHTLIDGCGGVILDGYCSVSSHCAIYSATHHHQFPGGHRAAQCNMVPIGEQCIVFAPVRMHKNSSIRWGSVVLPGVEIGEWAVVAAGSLVDKDVPAETVVGGVPAKKISENKEGVEGGKYTRFVQSRQQLQDGSERGYRG